MQFLTTARLNYELMNEATILASIKCMRTPGQTVLSEILSSDRPAEMTDLVHDMAHGTYTRINIHSPGPLSLQYSAQATPTHSLIAGASLTSPHPSTLPAELLPFIYPSRYCQSDRLREVAEEIAGNELSAFAKVSRIVDWIHQHISYAPGTTSEQDSATDILEKRSGVCRDFSHLAIALVRALSIPARYLTAYAAQLEPQDFHACFEAYLGEQWCLFDPTHLAPLNGIVRIASGHDASDTALASLYGDIVGSEVQVCCTSQSPLSPITQDELRQSKTAFVLG
ncbi:Transglutaminase-like superfamily protein [Rubritalea squalenifaciens DSM 18772]|uniref:Transglutaminase-like superfamily protein n=1 Tax=Rubritalea squalenifaciens DSM 18772 TaxID=1123071 RepID=A0A1M6L7W1_9BACT|nr:transglutaminase family protein [Rubritalea squalenifaciens]SHJ67260.1 Transglutaminase-like superfamily protein [Rubritalea squalenifaciens DSM 18772]